MEITEVLSQIGLSKNETAIYLALLHNGPQSVLGLSKHVGLHRPAVYRLLDDMTNKGLVHITVIGKRKEYFAATPQDLLQYLNKKTELLRIALPSLESSMKSSHAKPKIVYYEGREQVKELFRQGLNTPSKKMYSFFPSKYMIELFGKREMEKIIDERVEEGIEVMTLRSEASEEKFEGSELTDKALREIRYLPGEQTFEMGMVITDNWVNLFSPIEENFGLQIQSESYAKLMRTFFMGMWSLSKERPVD